MKEIVDVRSVCYKLFVFVIDWDKMYFCVNNFIMKWVVIVVFLFFIFFKLLYFVKIELIYIIVNKSIVFVLVYISMVNIFVYVIVKFFLNIKWNFN